MFQIIILNLFLILPLAVSAQNLIPHVGNSCPTGLYSSGNYCKRINSSDREALPRASGKDCSIGWRMSGKYCVAI
jgi:hypothetical protein